MKIMFFILSFISLFYWFFTGVIDGITILPIFPLLMMLNDGRVEEWANSILERKEVRENEFK